MGAETHMMILEWFAIGGVSVIVSALVAIPVCDWLANR